MKRFFTLLGVALFLANSGAFAETNTLIDFSQLKGAGDNKMHAATTIDFSKQAGTAYTSTDKDAMKISLAITSWEVKLASSARTVTNQSNSYVKEAVVKSDAAKFANDTVMGVRVHFPDYGINSYAVVTPPFNIPAYATDPANTQAKPGSQFDGFGVLKNVGVIKSIQIWVLGRNYPNSLSLLLENEKGQEQEIFMGYLNFEGWRNLIWTNSNYQGEVRNRELKVIPLYPRSSPYVKLKGIVLHRDAAQDGGDVVSYVRDIKIVYDKAIDDSRKEEVDDEGVWSILKDREEKNRNFELSRLGNQQVLRSLELKKMANEAFDPTGANVGATKENGAAAAPAAAAPAPAAPAAKP